MMVHRIKTLPQFFEPAMNGNKNFEIRNNDRGYKKGDLIVSCEFDGLRFTGREMSGEITYVTNFGCIDGYVALGIDYGGF